MSSIGTALAAFGTLKSAYELVRELRKSNDPATLKAGIEELTDRLLAAREDAMRIVEQLEVLKSENSRLSAEITANADFERRASDYVMKETGWGSYVYVNALAKQGQSPRYCVHCFDNRRFSILQPTNVHPMSRCPACQTTLKA